MRNWYKRHRRSEVVVQKNVVSKKYQFRADSELTQDIEDFKEEMNQGDTKVITDILNDFFLTKQCREQKEDIEHLFQ